MADTNPMIPVLNRGTVLLINSDEALRTTLRDAIQRAGYGVHAHAEAASGVATLRTERVDLVITDLNLPGTGGLQLLEDIRTCDRDIPVVILTEPGTTAQAMEAIRRGAYSCLSKPVSVGTILETVDRGVAALKHNRSRSRFLSGADSTLSFSIVSDQESLWAAVDAFMDWLDFQCLHGLRWTIRTPLVNALDNAIRHGNRNSRKKKVEIKASVGKDEIRITVRDEGEGFDYRTVREACNTAIIPEGRGSGIWEILAFMDEVHWNEQGNEIRMVKMREQTPSGRRSRETYLS